MLQQGLRLTFIDLACLHDFLHVKKTVPVRVHTCPHWLELFFGSILCHGQRHDRSIASRSDGADASFDCRLSRVQFLGLGPTVEVAHLLKSSKDHQKLKVGSWLGTKSAESLSKLTTLLLDTQPAGVDGLAPGQCPRDTVRTLCC